MADSSFDVVSDFDRHEMVNAVDQTVREMRTRYDLKNSKSDLELSGSTVTIEAESEHIIQAIVDVLESKMVRRNLPLKILKPGEVQPAAGSRYRQTITLQRGINADLARELSKAIRAELPKVKVAIQGEELRVSGKNKDELQQAINLLRQRDCPVPLQFVNYR
jgi:uncharacterized protein YajQ (UPF0234 family)